ncbi:formate dehydrogenase subunit gamma [Azospirillum doebereinerae]|uniref:formate dehydrogenase subunit gamma n=1 Tax=Azospirillum doebereinerae TaxID=92933 RepID=UPI001EE54C18|nr:formate dehydrogenase subunit gamma [Azospirillum doebereinerae]MCG5243651.1 formate dehydrogenase subunit gamma [Azospirillum doebereinerae]
MNPCQPWSVERARTIVADNRHLRGALLPILHALQEEFGYIDEQAIPLLAGELNLSRADVHGVVSFYHEFRREKPGRHVIKVCRAEACQAMGANALVDHIKAKLQVDFHGTTADGAFTLEQVFCLGNCALSPAVMVDEHLYGRVSPARFDAIAAETAHPTTRPAGQKERAQ